MANENPDLTAAFISDIEKKIAALQAILLSLRSASALGALGASVEGIDIPSGASANGDMGQPIDLPEGAFLGKSVPACVKLYLSAAKRKKTIREIAAALREGGIESTSDNFDNVVTGALFRLRNAGEVLRFKDGWGLPEWYPAHIRAAAPSGPNKRSPKKKGKRNGRKTTTAKLPPVASEQAAPTKGKANERALDFLRSGKKPEYGLSDVGVHLGMGMQGARLVMGKLVKAGKVERTAHDTYRIPIPRLAASQG